MNRPDHWNAGGHEIASEAIQTRLLIEETWLETAYQLAQDAYLRQLAEQEQVTLTEEEMQRGVDEFRQQRRLYQAEDTHHWLQSHGLTVEQLGDYCELQMLREKLKAKLFPAATVQAEYQQHSERYRFVHVRHLLVEDRGAAEELLLNATEDEEDFAALARQYSTDARSRLGGGYLGTVSLEQPLWFSPHQIREMLAADPGTILGPWEMHSQYELIKVEAREQTPLEGSLFQAIQTEMLQELLQRKVPQVF